MTVPAKDPASIKYDPGCFKEEVILVTLEELCIYLKEEGHSDVDKRCRSYLKNLTIMNQNAQDDVIDYEQKERVLGLLFKITVLEIITAEFHIELEQEDADKIMKTIKDISLPSQSNSMAR